MTRILIVEDERAIRRSLEIGLRANGYEVLIAADGRTALQACTEDAPDLLLLDLGLPDLSGFEVLRRLRTWSTIPVIVLSARHGSGDKVAALDLGADDYVTKPFGLDELLARVRAAGRRAQTAERVITDDFVVDLAAGQVLVEDQPVRLTPIEWKLLAVLAASPGRLIGRVDLLHQVWGPSYGHETNYLRVYIANLRRKLEPDPARPRYLHTEPGIGYRFTP